MIKKNQLFILIKSLSKNEKRYFRLFSTRESSGSNYLKLFDAIDNQKLYDEKTIKENFKNEKFIKQLHVTKNYLRQLILKSLRNFHSQISKDAELKDILRNIEILFNKELHEHCRTELKKATDLANKYELVTGRVEIANWSRKIEQTVSPHNYDIFSKIIEQQRESIEILSNSNAYWQLAVGLSTAVLQNNKLDKELLLKGINNAVTLEAKVLYYNTLFLKYLQQKNETKAGQSLHTLLALLESLPHRIQEDPSTYVSCINNLVSFLIFKKKKAEALLLINKAKSIYEGWSITTENKTLLKQILRTYNIELEIYRDSKTILGKADFIDKTEFFVDTYVQKMPKEYLISFWFQLASVHFMRKDYSKSLVWINKFLNARFKKGRNDLQVQIRLLNLMVHFEQKNLFVLRYFVDSTRRYVKKIKQVQPYEDILLKFFTKLGKTPLLEYKEAFLELQQLLFPKKGKQLISNDILGFIDYREWIKSKIK